MKKALVLIVLFSILATTFTATMINLNRAEYYNNIKKISNIVTSNDKSQNMIGNKVGRSHTVNKNQRRGRICTSYR